MWEETGWGGETCLVRYSSTLSPAYPGTVVLCRYLAAASPADRAKLISAALGIANKLLLATEPFADFAHALKRSQGTLSARLFAGTFTVG